MQLVWRRKYSLHKRTHLQLPRLVLSYICSFGKNDQQFLIHKHKTYLSCLNKCKQFKLWPWSQSKLSLWLLCMYFCDFVCIYFDILWHEWDAAHHSKNYLSWLFFSCLNNLFCGGSNPIQNKRQLRHETLENKAWKHIRRRHAMTFKSLGMHRRPLSCLLKFTST